MRGRLQPILLLVLLTLSVAGCRTLDTDIPSSDNHLRLVPTPLLPAVPKSNSMTEIPSVVVDLGGEKVTPAALERFTVMVHQVPVGELLFALARDAKLNIDIGSDIQGEVSLKALDQPLLVLLERIAHQVPIRYRLEGDRLTISADTAYFHSYPVEYLNLSRRSMSQVDLATQISSTGFSGAAGSGAGSNNSRTQVENHSEHQFWSGLQRSLRQLLELEPEGVGSEVIISPESGYVTVKASSAQHRLIANFLQQLVASARRQVLVEATVIEVTLNREHQSGVDWSILGSELNGFEVVQSLVGQSLTSAPFVSATYQQPQGELGAFSGMLKLLQQFGELKVISSPKIIAMNNQTAVLKVVDNRVYFTVSVESSNNEGVTTVSFDTDLHTVPVGFVMSVTPFISASSEVLLNVRPTISRILGFVDDPNPALATAGVVSRVPEIQVREMESLLRVESGRIAMMGGLMQDRVDSEQVGVPLLADLPLLGGLFRHQRQLKAKTELLIFLRPTVVGALIEEVER